MLPPAIIETHRLLLRMPKVSDAEFMFGNYQRDPEVVKYVPFRPPTDISETRDVLGRALQQWSESKNASYSVCLRETGSMIGMVNVRPDGHMASFGYVIARAFWNRGFATEALRVLVDWSLSQPETYRAWTCCDCANKASARVMEKSGMTLEGTARRWGVFPNITEEPRDEYIYAKVK
jgi:RimJ/RimL family protein N-acetyltransferase